MNMQKPHLLSPAPGTELRLPILADVHPTHRVANVFTQRRFFECLFSIGPKFIDMFFNEEEK